MKTKTYNIVKTATVANHQQVGLDATIKSTSIAAALESIKARSPRFLCRHGGISMFRDLDGWLYMININHNQFHG